jgi:[glutamine synthetase] adenylyltransferase / [glutamine synthetase]-adenylyl-L-tyrosine phosphorylase
VTSSNLQAFLAGRLPARMVERLARHTASQPDPEGSLSHLERYAAAHDLPTDEGRLVALLTLAGHSPYLGGLLLRHPNFLEGLSADRSGPRPRAREDLQEDLARFQFLNAGQDISVVLRQFKQREYLRIALADFLGTADLAAITRALSQLADVLLDKAVRMAWGPLEARFGSPTSRDDQGHAVEAGFCVLGYGKLGGEELNYSSDIDIVYLYARDGETSGGTASGRGTIGNKEFFARLAADVTRLIGGAGSEGQVFRVDLGLRPGGKDGEPVSSLRSATAYYRSWAEPWERQALLKARAVAGDLDLGRRFLHALEPLVYPAAADPFLAMDIGAMKDRIDAHLSATGRSETDIKLGRGGIRELEFSIQALQLRYGGRDPWLRHSNSLLALHRLAEKGYVVYADYAALSQAYVFLRNLEHRLQLGQNRQTATLPSSPGEWRVLARRMRFTNPVAGRESEALGEELERHRGVVRAFYDSVFGAAAQARIGEATSDLWLDRMDDTTLRGRLIQAGVPEPDAVLKPVQMIRRLLQRVVVSGELRRALRKVEPVLLQGAVETRAPRRALGNLEKLLSSLAGDPETLLRFLSRRELLGPTLQLLARSDLLAGLLIRQPSILRALEARSRLLRTLETDDARALLRETQGGEHDPARIRAGQLRRRHQETLATVAIRDINRQASIRETLKSLSNLADATLELVIDLARTEMRERGHEVPETLRLGVLGLGRLGYRELDYESDLDLIFFHDGVGDAGERAAASRWCETIIRILSSLSQDGQLYRVDLRLRPSGGEGDLVPSFEGLRDYFRETAEVWELQSFLKARPVAGDLQLGERAVEEIESLVLERAASLGWVALARQVDSMRGRLQRGAGGRRGAGGSLKLAAGGRFDVHFCIELLQLHHAVRGPADKDTLRLLTHLNELGILSNERLATLYEGYLFLRALEHAMRLVHDRPLGALPGDAMRLRDLALAMEDEGMEGLSADRLLQLYRRHTAAVRSAYRAIVRAPRGGGGSFSTEAVQKPVKKTGPEQPS